MTAALVLLLAACGGSDGSQVIQSPSPPPITLRYAGADVSALERIEQSGGVFKDNSQSGDAIAILHAHGANLFRLRLFVNPNHADVQVNDLAYTVRLATRIKAAGAHLMLDIHYSDTWADPGHQDTPSAWAALPIDTLEQRVQAYTDSVVRTLKQANALPDIIQVGNEIDGGMLWPLGRISGAGYDTPAQWAQLLRLVQAGIRGARSGAGTDTVRIMLHYSQGADAGGTQWFFDHFATMSADYDMIGLSYYPWWHGTLAQLVDNLAATVQRYNKDVMIVETSYPWRSGGWENMVTNQAAMSWPVSAQGQANMLQDVMRAVSSLPNHGVGVVWWYPEAIQVTGLFVWGGGSLALFDAGGNLLPSAGILGAH